MKFRLTSITFIDNYTSGGHVRTLLLKIDPVARPGGTLITPNEQSR
jgi:hypothetical protein